MGESLRNMKAEAERRLDRFDAAEARALRPGDWLTFAAYPGLRLACYGRDARMWTYRFRSPADDRLRQVRLGRWPAVGWSGRCTAGTSCAACATTASTRS